MRAPHSVSARAGCTSRKNLICEDTQKYGYSTWASFTTLLSLIKPIFEEQDVVIISFINPVLLFLVSASNANRYRLLRPLVVFFFGCECILETAL